MTPNTPPAAKRASRVTPVPPRTETEAVREERLLEAIMNHPNLERYCMTTKKTPASKNPSKPRKPKQPKNFLLQYNHDDSDAEYAWNTITLFSSEADAKKWAQSDFAKVYKSNDGPIRYRILQIVAKTSLPKSSEVPPLTWA
jgi:hypothetical protein